MSQAIDASSSYSFQFALPPQSATAPRVLGKWELADLVNQGAFTSVYRARPARAASGGKAAYVIKMLRPELEEHPATRQLLRHEAEVGLTVSHPHLVPVLSAHVDEPPYYVVMPCLHGQTLEAKLARGGSLVPPVALWIARQVAEALDALHTAGWLHLDVKPANIFVSIDSHATLLDLGFARRFDESGSAADRPVMGSMSYIAPELLTSSFRADQRSDIYSLGVTLYRMLTGQQPFDGGDALSLARQHRQGLPRRMQSIAPHLPISVVRLVSRMLAKEPLRRPQDARGLVRRLVELEIETLTDRQL